MYNPIVLMYFKLKTNIITLERKYHYNRFIGYRVFYNDNSYNYKTYEIKKAINHIYQLIDIYID
jgi:hypothetical protein